MNLTKKIITTHSLPLDFEDFRSSGSYLNYVRGLGYKILSQANGWGFFKRYLNLFCIAKFLCTDQEPQIKLLQSAGSGHGLVIWIPWRRADLPAGWRYLPFLSFAPGRGFTILENDHYAQKWTQRAQRALKKFDQVNDLSIYPVTKESFLDKLQNSDFRGNLKAIYSRYYRLLTQANPGPSRNWLCLRGNRVLGGLAVLDYQPNASVHLVSFLNNDGRALQVGTGLINQWFKNSLQAGIQYLNFDNLRSPKDPKSWQGYTDFKMNFVDHVFFLKEPFFKIV